MKTQTPSDEHTTQKCKTVIATLKQNLEAKHFALAAQEKQCNRQTQELKEFCLYYQKSQRLLQKKLAIIEKLKSELEAKTKKQKDTIEKLQTLEEKANVCQRTTELLEQKHAEVKFLSSENVDLKKEILELKQSVDREAKTNAQSGQKIAELEAQLTLAKKELPLQQKVSEDLRERLDQKSTTASDQAQQIILLTQQVEAGIETGNKTRNELKKCKGQLAEFQSQMKTSERLLEKERWICEDLRSETERLRVTIESQKHVGGQLRKAMLELERAETELETLRKTFEEFRRNSLAENRKNSMELQQKNEEIGACTTDILAMKTNLKTEKFSFNDERTALETKISSLDLELSKLQRTYMQKCKDAAKVSADLAGKSMQLSKNLKEVRKLNTKILSLKCILKQNRQNNKVLRHWLEMQKNSLKNDLRKVTANFTSCRDISNREINAMKCEIDAQSCHIDVQKAQIDSQKSEINTLRCEVGVQQREIETQNCEIDTLKITLSKYLEERQKSVMEKDRMVRETDRLQSQLAAANEQLSAETMRRRRSLAKLQVFRRKLTTTRASLSKQNTWIQSMHTFSQRAKVRRRNNLHVVRAINSTLLRSKRAADARCTVSKNMCEQLKRRCGFLSEEVARETGSKYMKFDSNLTASHYTNTRNQNPTNNRIDQRRRNDKAPPQCVLQVRERLNQAESDHWDDMQKMGHLVDALTMDADT